MNYYLIDPNNLSIISGPHAHNSTELKKITRCGNPELLNLLAYNLVPEVIPTISENQKYGSQLVSQTEVSYQIVDKTKEDLEGEETVTLTILRNELKCTPRQIRMLLSQQNLLTKVESYINNMDEITKIEWEYAQEIKRNHPVILSLSVILGFTETQTDDLFKLAMNL